MKYPPTYSHFGTVCVPVLSGSNVKHASVVLRKRDEGDDICAFYGSEMKSLSLGTAKQLKEGSLDPYIDAMGRRPVFYTEGYNRFNTHRRKR